MYPSLLESRSLASTTVNAILLPVSEHAAYATVGGNAAQNSTEAYAAADAWFGASLAGAGSTDTGNAGAAVPFFAAALAASFCAFFFSLCCS